MSLIRSTRIGYNVTHILPRNFYKCKLRGKYPSTNKLLNKMVSF